MFSQDQISEFQKLFSKEFGYAISGEDATTYASKLIVLLETVYKYEKEYEN